MEYTQYKEDRILKGREIYISGQIQRLDLDSYLVKDKYRVDILDGDKYVCECKDYQYRSDLYCKHIIAVQMYQMDGYNTVLTV